MNIGGTMRKIWQNIKGIFLKVKQKINQMSVKSKIVTAVILVLSVMFGCMAHLYYRTSQLYRISGVF